MKRISSIIILTLASCVPVFAQEVFFNFNFAINPPPHGVGIPNNGAWLTGDLFSMAIYLSDVQPTSGRIVELADGGAFSTVFSFDNLVYAAYPPPAEAPAFSYEQSYQLTSPQIQSLMAGAWYAEVSYGNSSYLGQIVPVPEPSSLALLAGGMIALAATARSRLRR